MILRLFISGLLLVSATILHAQQSSASQTDWERYLNAAFLPAGHPKATTQINNISDPVLRQSAAVAQQIEQQDSHTEMSEIVVIQSTKSIQRKESVAKKEMAGAAEMDAEMVVSPAINLPVLIAAAEISTANENKKALYNRYKSEFPIHNNAYNYGKNVLQHLPASAILIVQGQLDAYPILAEQNTNNTRTDVLVINLQWLNETSYRNRISQQLGVNPNWKSGESIATLIQKLVNVAPERVHLAMTVDRNLLQQFASQLSPLGLVFALQPVSAQKHHQILSQFQWDQIMQSNLPEYIKALHANYLAALLIDEKQKQPVSIGSYNRAELLKSLYSQTGLKNPAEKFLKN